MSDHHDQPPEAKGLDEDQKRRLDEAVTERENI
jgi:hypothetical protein